MDRLSVPEKVLAVTIVVLLVAIGVQLSRQSRQPVVTKVVAEKLVATEQRLGIDFFDSNNEIRSRATSVYYLIAEDGTMAEVDRKEFVKVKVGQSFTSSKWR